MTSPNHSGATSMPSDRHSHFERLLADRILILDGAMGTMIQGYGLEEADYRGDRFVDHPSELKGDNELLSLTRPAVIEEIHDAFFAAGADIVVYSAHKFLGGPTAGIVAGRKDLVRATYLQSHGIGRGKVRGAVAFVCIGSFYPPHFGHADFGPALVRIRLVDEHFHRHVNESRVPHVANPVFEACLYDLGHQVQTVAGAKAHARHEFLHRRDARCRTGQRDRPCAHLQ